MSRPPKTFPIPTPLPTGDSWAREYVYLLSERHRLLSSLPVEPPLTRAGAQSYRYYVTGESSSKTHPYKAKTASQEPDTGLEHRARKQISDQSSDSLEPPTLDTNLRLPFELIEEIFDYAAIDSPDACRRICSVCRWAHTTFFTSRLLPTVVLSTLVQATRFYPTPAATVQPKLGYVRSLYIAPRATVSAIHNHTLRSAEIPHLRHLALHGSCLHALATAYARHPPIGLRLTLLGEKYLPTCTTRERLALLVATERLEVRWPLARTDTSFARTFPRVSHVASVYSPREGVDHADHVVGLVPALMELEMVVFVLQLSTSKDAPVSSDDLWECRKKIVQARRADEQKRNRFFVESLGDEKEFKKRWIQTTRGEFPSIWKRAREQTTRLEEIYEAAGKDWAAAKVHWEEECSTASPSV